MEVLARRLSNFVAAPLGAALLLLAEVLVFFRKIVLDKDWTIPWDFTAYHLPLFCSVAKSIAGREWPWWDAFNYGGFPIFANPQAQVFYPPAWPFYLIAAAINERYWLEVYEWMVVLHVWVAAVFAWRLARAAGAEAHAALLAGTTYALGAFYTAHISHAGAACAAAWLPLVWLGMWQRRWKLVAAGLALSLLAGFPAMVYVAFGTALLVGDPRVWLRGALCSIVLSAPMLLSAAQLASLSKAGERGVQEVGGGLHWQAWQTLVFPWKISKTNIDSTGLPASTEFLFVFCGWLALVALLRNRDWRWWLVLAGVVAVMMGDRTPGFTMVYNWLPRAVKGSLYPEFFLAGFVLVVGVMAARGAGKYGLIATAIAFVELLSQNSRRVFHLAKVQDSGAIRPHHFEGSEATLLAVRELTGIQWRIETIDDSMACSSAAPITRIPHIGGNDPLEMRAPSAVRALYAKRVWPDQRYRVLEDGTSPVLDLLNVRYLLRWAPNNTTPPEIPGLQFVRGLPGHSLYENPDALPRWYVAPRWRTFESFEQLRTIKPGAEVLIDGAPGAGSAGTIEDMNVRCAARCLVASSVVWYPGWSIRIDGIEAPVEKVNGAHLGVFVDGGEHKLTARFWPRLF